MWSVVLWLITAAVSTACAAGEVGPPRPEPNIEDPDAGLPPPTDVQLARDVPVVRDAVAATDAWRAPDATRDVLIPPDPAPPRDAGVTPMDVYRPPPPPSSDPCESSTSCGTCTPRAGCGFCSNVGRCLSGTFLGPANGACNIFQWAWLPTQCGGGGTFDAGVPRVDSGAGMLDVVAPRDTFMPPPPPSMDSGTVTGTCVSTVPTSGFCTSVGCNLSPMTFTRCDDNTPYAIYGAEYCSARATLIVVSAGWCSACQTEAPVLERDVTNAYRARGVRVLSLLDENPDRSPATVAFCTRWRDRYGLTSRMVVDPTSMTSRALRISAYPFMAVIDRRGRIRLAEALPSTSRLRAVIEAALAE